MERVYEFLKKCETYFVATSDEIDETQPRVRPFGTIEIFDGKLCFQTGRQKSVSKQLHNNPKIEICAYDAETNKWLRLTCVAVEEARLEAQRQILDAYPELKSIYAVDDGVTEVFKIEHGVAVIFSLTDAPVTIKF
ncbi:MAG: pyridoxamine 5'-phosphate oxidase family protein [Thermoguttaceae bacterium]|jgi:uncharacterized pyridoxamine 5'-phosphate oxidase family protein